MIDTILTAVIAVATIIGVIATYISAWRVQGETIRSCFGLFRDTEFINAREFVYNLRDSKDKYDVDKFEPVEKGKVLLVITTMQFWGVLADRNYLPLNLFNNTDEGVKICRCYENLKDYINHRRNDKGATKNEHYADAFEKLYYNIMKNTKTNVL